MEFRTTQQIIKDCKRRGKPNCKSIDDMTIGVHHNHLIGNVEAHKHLQTLKAEASSIDEYIHKMKLFLEDFGISWCYTSYPNRIEKVKGRYGDKTIYAYVGSLCGNISLDEELYNTKCYGNGLEDKWHEPFGLLRGDSSAGGGGENFTYHGGCYADLEQFPRVYKNYKYKEPILRNEDNIRKFNDKIDSIVEDFKDAEVGHYSNKKYNDVDYRKLTSKKYELSKIIDRISNEIELTEKRFRKEATREASFHLEIPDGLESDKLKELSLMMYPNKFSPKRGEELKELYKEISDFEDEYPELFL